MVAKVVSQFRPKSKIKLKLKNIAFHTKEYGQRIRIKKRKKKRERIRTRNVSV